MMINQGACCSSMEYFTENNFNGADIQPLMDDDGLIAYQGKRNIPVLRSWLYATR
jgi:hypothetical protein